MKALNINTTVTERKKVNSWTPDAIVYHTYLTFQSVPCLPREIHLRFLANWFIKQASMVENNWSEREEIENEKETRCMQILNYPCQQSQQGIQDLTMQTAEFDGAVSNSLEAEIRIVKLRHIRVIVPKKHHVVECAVVDFTAP